VPHGFYTQLVYEGIIAGKDAAGAFLRAYRKRSNYPQGGSIGTDMYDQIRGGQSFDFPTPAKFRESDATKMPLIAGTKLIPDFKYFQYVDKNWKILHDDIVKDVAIGKAVSIFIYATDEEWSKEYVDIIDPNYQLTADSDIRHCVCIIPKGDFTKNGKGWVSIQDSAKFGGRGLRYVSYDFLKKRTYFAAKVYKTSEIPVPPTPPVVIGLPLTPCKFGDKNDFVLALQKYLIKGGYLEAKYATSYYGSLTSRAVLWFQLKNHGSFTSNIPAILDGAGKQWGNESIGVVKKIGGY